MGDIDNEQARLATLGQIADRLELLVQVCRLIARRVGSADVSAEVLELASWIHNEADRLRMAMTRLHG
jgi:hypothetical protein